MRCRSLLAILVTTALAASTTSGPVFAQDGAEPTGTDQADDDPVFLEADSVEYDVERDVVTARGNVSLSTEERTLLADSLSYDQTTGQVVAEGRVVLIEPSGDTLFADRVEVTDDLREGSVEQLKVLLSDNARIVARKGVRVEGNRTEFDDALYTPCEICPDSDGAPLWRLRADKVVHDQEDREVRYRNTFLEVYGVPVLYTPFFSHPDPTVDRKSGFLGPEIGNDSELGFRAEVPYFIDLGPNRDATLTPIFLSNEPIVLELEYRDLQPFGITELGGSITPGASELQSDGTLDDEIRGHLEGVGRYRLGGAWIGGFDLDLATDDTYLSRYDFSEQDVLRNRVFGERVWDRNFLDVSAYYFQGLRIFDDPGEIPFAAPFVRTRLRDKTGFGASRWTVDASALALQRTDGIDTRRVSVEGGLELPMRGLIGDVITTRLSVRNDFYNVNGDADSGEDDGTVRDRIRVLPRFTADWRWPLIRPAEAGSAWSYTLEPMVTLTSTPRGGNDDQIPNEDSIEFEFDDTNLLEPIRFTGLDLIEDGTKIAYALSFAALENGRQRFAGFLGQSIRLDDSEDAFDEFLGLEGRSSDYVGRLDASPNPFFNLSYRFRIDNETADLTRSETILAFGPPRLRFGIGHVRLGDEVSDEGFDDREELRASVNAGITPNLNVVLSTRQALDAGETVRNAAGLVYRNSCVNVFAGVERDFTADRDASDTTTISLRLTLRNLGEFGGDSSIFGG
ncbi:MAG: LPS-assembly protein LptD [Geminicoccaceae bacterium]